MKNCLRFDDGEWERTEENWTAWWCGELDRPMVIIETMTDPRYSLDTWSEHLTRFPLSQRMFERLVLPDLIACCDALDYGFYHLDGKGQIKHLDMLLAIERLRGIQWIPGDGAPPPEEWLPLLKRIRDTGKLCQVYVTPDGALKVARALGGKGFAFCIGSGAYLTPAGAAACYEAFRLEGLVA